ncbi:MAG: hypothetical protein ACMUIP_03440 [bacterium]
MEKTFSFKIIAIGFSVILIALLLFLFKPQKIQGPEKDSDIIWKMYSLAKVGDVDNFLKCFTEKSKAIMESSRKKGKELDFEEYIKKHAVDIKGMSIINKRDENESSRVYDIEVVYQDRNEQHTVFLQNTKKGWKISRISKPVIIKPEIPYLKQVIGEDS